MTLDIQSQQTKPDARISSMFAHKTYDSALKSVHANKPNNL